MKTTDCTPDFWLENGCSVDTSACSTTAQVLLVRCVRRGRAVHHGGMRGTPRCASADRVRHTEGT
eukprot:9962967-Alexandrium_andersonii.AAC.1